MMDTSSFVGCCCACVRAFVRVCMRPLLPEGRVLLHAVQGEEVRAVLHDDLAKLQYLHLLPSAIGGRAVSERDTYIFEIQNKMSENYGRTHDPAQ